MVRSLLRIPAVPRHNPKMTLQEEVDTLGGKWRNGSRFSKNPSGRDPKLAGVASARYDTESRGPKAAMSAAVESSPLQYRAVFASRTSRFDGDGKGLDLVYDTARCGRSADMSDAVLRSDRVYSAMRSTSSRFEGVNMESAHRGPGYIVADKPQRRVATMSFAGAGRFESTRPHTAAPSYTVDVGLKASLSTSVKQSARSYSALRSETERFKTANVDPHLRSAMERLSYTVDHGNRMTMSTAVKHSGLTYRNVMDSSQPRFRAAAGKDKHLVETMASVEYEVDHGPKATLATAVKQSRRVYTGMRSSSPRFKDSRPKTAAADLGPGHYDGTAGDNMLKRRVANPVQPTAPRFTSKVDPARNLGSTYRPERDMKSWTSKGFATPVTERPSGVRPMVDQMYVVDQGTVAHSIKTSSRKYAAAMASTSTRGEGPAGSSDIGPGKYDYKIKMNSHPAVISVKDPAKGTSTLSSTANRFKPKLQDRHLQAALQTVDYHAERFGTIDASVRNTEMLYSTVGKGTSRM